MGPCRLVPAADSHAKMIMRMLRKYSIAANTMHSDKVGLTGDSLGPLNAPKDLEHLKYLSHYRDL